MRKSYRSLDPHGHRSARDPRRGTPPRGRPPAEWTHHMSRARCVPARGAFAWRVSMARACSPDHAWLPAPSFGDAHARRHAPLLMFVKRVVSAHRRALCSSLSCSSSGSRRARRRSTGVSSFDPNSCSLVSSVQSRCFTSFRGLSGVKWGCRRGAGMHDSMRFFITVCGEIAGSSAGRQPYSAFSARGRRRAWSDRQDQPRSRWALPSPRSSAMEAPQDFAGGRELVGRASLHDAVDFPLVSHLDLDHCSSFAYAGRDGAARPGATPDPPTMHYTLRSCEAGSAAPPSPRRAAAGVASRLYLLTFLPTFPRRIAGGRDRAGAPATAGRQTHPNPDQPVHQGVPRGAQEEARHRHPAACVDARQGAPLLTPPAPLPSCGRARPRGHARVPAQRARLLLGHADPYEPGRRAHLRCGRLGGLRVRRQPPRAAGRPAQGAVRARPVERRHRAAERRLCQPRNAAALAPAVDAGAGREAAALGSHLRTGPGPCTGPPRARVHAVGVRTRRGGGGPARLQPGLLVQRLARHAAAHAPPRQAPERAAARPGGGDARHAAPALVCPPPQLLHPPPRPPRVPLPRRLVLHRGAPPARPALRLLLGAQVHGRAGRRRECAPPPGRHHAPLPVPQRHAARRRRPGRRRRHAGHPGCDDGLPPRARPRSRSPSLFGPVRVPNACDGFNPAFAAYIFHQRASDLLYRIPASVFGYCPTLPERC